MIKSAYLAGIDDAWKKYAGWAYSPLSRHVYQTVAPAVLGAIPGAITGAIAAEDDKRLEGAGRGALGGALGGALVGKGAIEATKMLDNRPYHPLPSFPELGQAINGGIGGLGGGVIGGGLASYFGTRD